MPNFDGEVLGVGGHAHDGAATVQIQVNNQINCDSTVKYAETPEYVFKPAMKMEGAAMGVATNHISSMKTCFYDDNKVRKLDPSQKWRIQALYDYDKYPGNKDMKGKQEGIMAIAIMYVAIKPGTMLTGGAAPAPAAAAGGAAPAAPAGGAAPAPAPAAGAFAAKGLPKAVPKGQGQSTAAPPTAVMPGMPGMGGKRNYLADGEAYWE